MTLYKYHVPAELKWHSCFEFRIHLFGCMCVCGRRGWEGVGAGLGLVGYQVRRGVYLKVRVSVQVVLVFPCVKGG